MNISIVAFVLILAAVVLYGLWKRHNRQPPPQGTANEYVSAADVTGADIEKAAYYGIPIPAGVPVLKSTIDHIRALPDVPA